MRDNYAYDNNGNVTSILDGQEGYHRSMYYDGLNRLQRVAMPSLWGDAWFGYDALDNLVSMQLTARSNMRATTHTFDPNTNLLKNISNGIGTKYNYAYQYDERGNVTRRGDQAFRLDLANRMTSAVGKATYAYDGLGRRFSIIGGINRIQVYSQEGQLLYTTTAARPLQAGTKYIYLHNHLIAEVER